MKLALGTALVIAIAASAAACTAPADDSTASSDAALSRDLQPNEILGEIKYGVAQDVDLTLSPEYRAFYFNGERGDQVTMTATSADATDPILWFLDDRFTTLGVNNDVRPTDTSSSIAGRYLPRTGKYYVAFREMNHAPKAKFTIAVRKTGALPAACDPNGEGTFDSECTDPQGIKPFEPDSCAGADMTPAAAKKLFGGTNGYKPAKASILYMTRQCDPANQPACSDWVYAFAMDVKLATVKAKDGAPGTYTFASDTTRKTAVDFAFGDPPPENSGLDAMPFLKQACIDGPFASTPLSAETSTAWTAFPDGTAGVCSTALAHRAAKMTSTCARFELPSITLGSGESTHYTEYSPVLYAKF